MITMFQIEKLLEIFAKKPKTPQGRRLQRSPKIIGYARECSDDEMSLELNEPLLSYEDITDYGDDHDDADDQGKNMNGVVCNKSSNNNNSNVRVKVLLTKGEAAKLLAKCNEGGVLDFQDVFMQLEKLPTQRIDVVSVNRFSNSYKDLELATIVEEAEEEEEEEEEEEQQ